MTIFEKNNKKWLLWGDTRKVASKDAAPSETTGADSFIASPALLAGVRRRGFTH